MSPFRRQFGTCNHVCQYLASIALLLFSAANAGEAATDPTDSDITVTQDWTPDSDSRSGRASAPAEQQPGPTPVREYMGPLANAVMDAEGRAEPLRLLETDIAPGTSERLSWSGTELFEGVPVSTPVLVTNGSAPGAHRLPDSRCAR